MKAILVIDMPNEINVEKVRVDAKVYEDVTNGWEDELVWEKVKPISKEIVSDIVLSKIIDGILGED